jgi:Concanavalin A-like lectin/glucanases superfamily
MPLSSLQSNRFNRSMNDLGNSGSSKTIALPENYDAMLTCSLNANCTFTMPSPVNGYKFSLLLKQDGTGGRTATFTGVRWPNSTAPTISTTLASMDIINFFSDGNYWYGYYSNSQNFDSYSGSGDKYFNSVVLLLHMDGSGNTFVDSSPTPKTLTVTGNTTQSTTQSQFGGKSAYFDGSTYSYIDAGNASSLTFTSSTLFVVEGWIYPIRTFNGAQNGFRNIVSKRNPGTSNTNWAFFLNFNSNQLVFWNGAGSTYKSSAQVTLNAWTYFAWVYGGNGTLNLYINDAIDSTFSVSPGVSVSDSVKIGSLLDDTNTQNNFGGYIDDLRITVGSNRGYTGSTIVVPTSAFPNNT